MKSRAHSSQYWLECSTECVTGNKYVNHEHRAQTRLFYGTVTVNDSCQVVANFFRTGIHNACVIDMVTHNAINWNEMEQIT